MGQYSWAGCSLHMGTQSILCLSGLPNLQDCVHPGEHLVLDTQRPTAALGQVRTPSAPLRTFHATPSCMPAEAAPGAQRVAALALLRCYRPSSPLIPVSPHHSRFSPLGLGSPGRLQGGVGAAGRTHPRVPGDSGRGQHSLQMFFKACPTPLAACGCWSRVRRTRK